MTMTLTQFYDLAGVPIREIFAILAKEQNVQPDLDAMAARCGTRGRAHEGRPEPHRACDRNSAPRALEGRTDRGGVQRREAHGHGSPARPRRAHMFQAVVTCEGVKQGKPAPDLYLLAAEKLGVDPTRCVAYEDAELGMESARRAGMTVVDVRDIEGVPDPRKDR